MQEIRLELNSWRYDPDKQLGAEGGFGTVYEGLDQASNPVAVKKLKISAREAAHRELRMAGELVDRNLNNVIPVLDSGLDANSDSYFVVMPLAQKSLQDDIDERGTFADVEAASILLEICNGLSEVGDIVHRDLKPANVLYHDATWKIADFGIARFVEESTSLRTLKESLTPPYAAPEQWNFVRATAATDIYALGCIGYALLTGKPPFEGPGTAEFKQQHLAESPPNLEGVAPELSSLLAIMLRKTKDTRPDLQRVTALLNNMLENIEKGTPGKGLIALAEAGAQSAARHAEAEAEVARAEANAEKRKRIAAEAIVILYGLIKNFKNRICARVPHATCSGASPCIKVCVERNMLSVRNLSDPIPMEAFSQSASVRFASERFDLLSID